MRRSPTVLLVITTLCLVLSAVRADATTVFSTDFESGLPAEMTAAGTQIVGVQGWAGLGPVGNQFGGNFLRYHAVTILDTRLELTNLPPHDRVDLSFLLAVIDSWDGTELLKVSIDGVEVFSHWFQLATGDASSYVAPTGGLLSSGVNLGFTNGTYYFRDRAYDMSVEPVFSIPHTASTLTIVWYLGAVSGSAAQNWQGGGDESWAIDNVRVDVTSDPTGIGDAPFPRSLTLLPNAPNPFSGVTTLQIGSTVAGEASIEVFDVSGRRVRAERVPLAAGWQGLAWNGLDDDGKPLPSGVYFYRIHANGQTQAHKFIITR